MRQLDGTELHEEDLVVGVGVEEEEVEVEREEVDPRIKWRS